MRARILLLFIYITISFLVRPLYSRDSLISNLFLGVSTNYEVGQMNPRFLRMNTCPS